MKKTILSFTFWNALVSIVIVAILSSVALSAPANLVVQATDELGYFQGAVIAGSAPNAFPASGSPQVSWEGTTGKITLLGVKTIFVMNVDDTDSLDYYMTIKATSSQPESVFPTHGVVATPIALATGADTFISFSDAVAEVNIYFRNTVSDSIADWEVYVSGRR